MNLPSVLVLTCLLLVLPPALGGKGSYSSYTDSPPLQSQPPTQPQPTQSPNTTGQCTAGYLVQGPLVGPPGRDGREGPPGREGIPGTNGSPGRDGQPGRRGQPGPSSLPGIDGADGQPGRDGKNGQPGRDGLDGKQGPPGPPGPSGLDFEELREIVNVLAMQEIKNITANASPQSPLKVVVECCNSTSSAVTRPPTTPTTQAPNSLPTTRSPQHIISHQCRNTTGPCPGLSATDPAKSCYDIYLCDRSLPSGYYWVKRYHYHGLSYSHARVYCYMEDDKCGRGGVMRVVYMNMTENPVCPFPLKLYNASGKMICGPTNPVATKCDSVTFSTYLIPYNFVCGKAVGYSYKQTYAFYYSTSSGYNSIELAYLSGLSITTKKRGQRQHVWSYVAGYHESTSSTLNCPCAANPGKAAPLFVGNDFYCESGSHSAPSSQWYTSNPLWDGKGCYAGSKCCDNIRMPWFWKCLPEKTTSDLEIRWCQPGGGAVYDRVGIEHLEMYVY